MDPGGQERKEEQAELVRTLIEKRGIIVKLLDNNDDLKTVVQLWNEKKKDLGEYFFCAAFCGEAFHLWAHCKGGHNYDMTIEMSIMSLLIMMIIMKERKHLCAKTW